MTTLQINMEEPCFNELRTQRQLGYSVYTFSDNTFGTLGFHITVFSQASSFT